MLSPQRYSRIPRYSGPVPRRIRERRASPVAGAEERTPRSSSLVQAGSTVVVPSGSSTMRARPTPKGAVDDTTTREGPHVPRGPAIRSPSSAIRSPGARDATNIRARDRCSSSRSSIQRIPREAFASSSRTRAGEPCVASSGAERVTSTPRSIRVGSAIPPTAAPSNSADSTNNQPDWTFVPIRNSNAEPPTSAAKRLVGRGIAQPVPSGTGTWSRSWRTSSRPAAVDCPWVGPMIRWPSTEGAKSFTSSGST